MDRSIAVALLESLPLPVLLIGTGDRVQFANTQAEALFGADLAGRNPATVLRQPGFLDALEATLRTNSAMHIRLAVPTRGMIERSLSVHLAPVRDLDGQQGVLVTFEDLSALDVAEAMRRDFVANVSHELRTPLTALMGFIETLRGAARDDPAARDRFLGIMDREAGRMIRLVNDLLSLSRVEAEERRRPDDPVDVVALTKSAAITHRPRAESAGVELQVDCPEGEQPVRGDSDQLLQVIGNLVENAIKYGAAGKVVILRVTHLPRDPVLRGPAVMIEVIDRGDGIDMLHLPRLTERFYRVDAHRSREQGGTGLGLAIVKHIVNRHRGRLRIESEPGKGSTFSVILPRL